MVFMDFCVPSHLLEKQRMVTSMVRAWGPRYGGPGANFISLVLSKEGADELLQKLVTNRVGLRVLARSRSGSRGDEAVLVLADPPALGSALCERCGTRHTATTCPECSVCKKDGHWAFACPDGVRCWACNKLGHTSQSAVCGLWDSTKVCITCKSVGHLFYHCQLGI